MSHLAAGDAVPEHQEERLVETGVLLLLCRICRLPVPLGATLAGPPAEEQEDEGEEDDPGARGRAQDEGVLTTEVAITLYY